MSYDQQRDLTPEERGAAIEAATAAARAAVSPVTAAALAVVLYDDRGRAIGDMQRRLATGAAALAQQHLKIADELMRMAGNGWHNSPNGFDRVARDVLQATAARTADAQRDGLLLTEVLHEFVDRGGWEQMMVVARARREWEAEQRTAAQEERERAKAAAAEDRGV